MYRNLTEDEVRTLQAQGCTAEDWSRVQVKEGFNARYVEDARFSGDIRLGVFNRSFMMPGGVSLHSGIYHAILHNCEIGDDCHIYSIHNYIANYKVGANSRIENVNALYVEGRTTFGNGVRVPVMNEGGGREIPIFDRLSASLAYILTLYRHRPELISTLDAMIDAYAESVAGDMGEIGEDVCILNCGAIKNVRIGDCAQIRGTSRLKNGTVNSNRFAPVKLGSGVKCKDFIIASGVEISDSTIVDKCFVGQGCIFDKHYSAGESLFFSNCQGMHGEAAAIFAGPYTVTHHKSTLLIAGMFSFLNAGSGSNQSNHMYKLGPIHQGVAERGAKTTSDSYLLWPSKVGAFSLVMGRHTHHTDTADLPFSYLIEQQSVSYIVPGVNLKSVGTIRDVRKWPQRDKRTDPVLKDCINFNLLSPYTIQKMFAGTEILNRLREASGHHADNYWYKKGIIKGDSLCKGLRYYDMAIRKFLGNSLISRIEKADVSSDAALRAALVPDTEIGRGRWVDAAGLIAPSTEIEKLCSDIKGGAIADVRELHDRFVAMHSNYYSYEWTWSHDAMKEFYHIDPETITRDDAVRLIKDWEDAVVSLDKLVYADAGKEFKLSAMTSFGIDGDKSRRDEDFAAVRGGTFEENPFVHDVQEHIRRKSALADKMIERLTK